jgi:hypothetical protein
VSMRLSNERAYVRFWPKADMQPRRLPVAFGVFDLSRPSTCSVGHEFDPLKAGAHVAAAIGSDLSVDASLVSATYRAILKCLSASPT